MAAELTDDGNASPRLTLDVPGIAHHEFEFERSLGATTGLITDVDPRSDSQVEIECDRSAEGIEPTTMMPENLVVRCEVLERVASAGEIESQATLTVKSGLERVAGAA